MRIERMGEKALLLRDLPFDPASVARVLSKAGVGEEAVASYETVGVYFAEPVLDTYDFDAILREHREEGAEGKSHVIPVCYEMGEDLAAAAASLQMSVASLVERHSAAVYKCFAVGFCPGFAYLGYLPPEIAGLARLPSPRTRIEPGSVAMTGRQTAVYPLPTPGGWHLVGRTPLVLVDEDDDYFPIEAGDTVRFSPIDADEFARLKGERL